MKKVLLMVMLFALCAHNKLTAAARADAMIPVSCWQDMAPFIGKIIAYTSTHHYFQQNTHAFTLIPDMPGALPVRYGFVRDSSDTPKAFRAINVLHRDGGSGECFLYDERIKGSNLCIRRITDEERLQLKEAMQNNDARFYFIFNKEDALALLS